MEHFWTALAVACLFGAVAYGMAGASHVLMLLICRRLGVSNPEHLCIQLPSVVLRFLNLAQLLYAYRFVLMGIAFIVTLAVLSW
jgi:hypothetical protein